MVCFPGDNAVDPVDAEDDALGVDTDDAEESSPTSVCAYGIPPSTLPGIAPAFDDCPWNNRLNPLTGCGRDVRAMTSATALACSGDAIAGPSRSISVSFACVSDSWSMLLSMAMGSGDVVDVVPVACGPCGGYVIASATLYILRKGQINPQLIDQPLG